MEHINLGAEDETVPQHQCRLREGGDGIGRRERVLPVEAELG